MLPLIVIGADETVTAALNHLEVPARLYPNAETAAHALNDEVDRAGKLGHRTPELIDFDDSGPGWQVNVAYGPKVLGRAAIGKPDVLAHTGWTLVLDHHLADNDPSRARRVYEGAPEGQDNSTIVWQAAPMLRANFVVDVTAGSGPNQARALSQVLDHMTQHLQP